MCLTVNNWKGTKGCGRGGAGPNKYVWALLDWGTGVADRRRQYLAMGGDSKMKVTEKVWGAFLAKRNTAATNVANI